MSDSVHTFSYTAQRTSYLTIVGALLFLIGVETGVTTLLVIVLVHNLLVQFALHFAFLAFLIFIVIRLFAPLRTRHTLSDTHLSLHYGTTFRATIPRDDILDAQAVREHLMAFGAMSAQFDAKKQRIIAAFSEQGQVLLRLNKPHTFKVNGKTVLANTLLINVDKRDEFLQALEQQQGDRKGLPYTSAPLAVGETLAVSQPPIPTVPSFTTQPAIHIANLTRRFGTRIAVDNLSMTIQQGEIYGFLGTNGAGKTTMMKVLVGLLQPDEGRAWLAGHDIARDALAAKVALGYVADRSILYERLTGREFLLFLSAVRGIARKDAERSVARLLEVLELTEVADALCGSYSFGMKRKLSLAGALLHKPSVLILDEPLNGLDPQSARNLKDLLLDLAAQGTAILLSTHDLATAETLCRRIGIIYKGRLLAEGTASELRQRADASDLETVFLTLTAQAKEAVTL